MPTPLDLAVEVLTLKRGRYVCPDTIALFGLPHTLPYVCSDWVAFLFQAVAPESLSRIHDLRHLLMTQLDARASHDAELAALNPGFFEIALMRGRAYMHIEHGLMASPLEDGHPSVTFHEVLARMGRCMNLSSHVMQFLDTPGPGLMGKCLALGEALCTLCMEHRVACRVACFSEGRGLLPRYVPPGMLFCEPRRSPFFGGGQDGAPGIPTTVLPQDHNILGGHATTQPRDPSLTEPPGPREALPSPYLFKEGHFDPLVGHYGQHHPHQQPQQPLPHPGGPIGGHPAPLPADGGVGAWTRRQRQRENEQPAPVFIRDEGEEGGNADPRVEPGPHRNQDTGLGGAWRVVGTLGGGAAVPRESPVTATDSLWAAQGEWGGGGEAPGADHQVVVVGRRRRRGEGEGAPGYVAWGSGGGPGGA